MQVSHYSGWTVASWVDIFGLLGTPSATRLKTHLPWLLTIGPLKVRSEWFLSKVANIKTRSCLVFFFSFPLSFSSFLLSSALFWTFSCYKKSSSFHRPPFQKSLVDMYFNKTDRVQILRQIKSICTHRELVMCLFSPSLPSIINPCKIKKERKEKRNSPSHGTASCFVLSLKVSRWRYAFGFP